MALVNVYALILLWDYVHAVTYVVEMRGECKDYRNRQLEQSSCQDVTFQPLQKEDRYK